MFNTDTLFIWWAHHFASLLKLIMFSKHSNNHISMFHIKGVSFDPFFLTRSWLLEDSRSIKKNVGGIVVTFSMVKLISIYLDRNF